MQVDWENAASEQQQKLLTLCVSQCTLSKRDMALPLKGALTHVGFMLRLHGICDVIPLHQDSRRVIHRILQHVIQLLWQLSILLVARLKSLHPIEKASPFSALCWNQAFEYVQAPSTCNTQRDA